MKIALNNGVNYLTQFAIPFKDSIPYLDSRLKKIVAVVALAFCCLATLYLCQRKLKTSAIQEKNEEPKEEIKLEDLKGLEEKLSAKIIGQPYAIKVTVNALKRHVSGLKNSKSPIGTFLYVGPTGVGKTQLAKELALEIFGDENRLIRMDMSAFSEEHSLTRLIGALPGYKQHEQGGQLTEALKEHSSSIVLLDEIDKANPAVLKTFLRVFDEGIICDAKGDIIDCRNTIFILTTNLASKKILQLSQDGVSEEEILENIRKDIVKHISPELYNRLEITPFLGLGEEQLDELVKNMLKEVEKDLFERKDITVDWDLQVIDYIKSNGFDYELGARPLRRMLEKTVNTVIAQEIIAERIQSGDCVRVYLVDDEVRAEKKAS